MLSGFRAVAEWGAQHLGLDAGQSYAYLQGLFCNGVRGDAFNRWLAHFGAASPEPEENAADLVTQAVTVYRQHEPAIQPFPEALTALPSLHLHYRLGLVSDGCLAVQQRKLAALGIEPHDDLQYLIDLGLVTRGGQGPQIANPIYQEIIPRQLTDITQANLESLVNPSWYVGADGRLQMDKLLAAFQQFFRENSAHWIERFQHQEAGPQLLLQAYLQRIVNGSGYIQREYGLGRAHASLDFMASAQR